MNVNKLSAARSGAVIGAMTMILTACSGVNPSTLHVPSRPAEVFLGKTVEWTYQVASLRPVTYRGSISQGKYVAEYESPEGVYFRGPPGCFSSEAIAVSADDQRAALDKVFEQACGLFVPANKTDDVKLYVYLGSQIKLRGVPSSVSPTTIDTLTSATQITMGMPVAGSMLGGVIAGAIIDGINAGEKGNLRFYHRQPAPEELKKALMQD